MSLCAFGRFFAWAVTDWAPLFRPLSAFSFVELPYLCPFCGHLSQLAMFDSPAEIAAIESSLALAAKAGQDTSTVRWVSSAEAREQYGAETKRGLFVPGNTLYPLKFVTGLFRRAQKKAEEAVVKAQREGSEKPVEVDLFTHCLVDKVVEGAAGEGGRGRWVVKTARGDIKACVKLLPFFRTLQNRDLSSFASAERTSSTLRTATRHTSFLHSTHPTVHTLASSQLAPKCSRFTRPRPPPHLTGLPRSRPLHLPIRRMPRATRKASTRTFSSGRTRLPEGRGARSFLGARGRRRKDGNGESRMMRASIKLSVGS